MEVKKEYFIYDMACPLWKSSCIGIKCHFYKTVLYWKDASKETHACCINPTIYFVEDKKYES